MKSFYSNYHLEQPLAGKRSANIRQRSGISRNVGTTYSDAPVFPESSKIIFRQNVDARKAQKSFFGKMLSPAKLKNHFPAKC
jgi:hypothetical protein